MDSLGNITYILNFSSPTVKSSSYHFNWNVNFTNILVLLSSPLYVEGTENLHTLKLPSENVKMFAYSHCGRNNNALSHPPKIYVLITRICECYLTWQSNLKLRMELRFLFR